MKILLIPNIQANIVIRSTPICVGGIWSLLLAGRMRSVISYSENCPVSIRDIVLKSDIKRKMFPVRKVIPDISILWTRRPMWQESRILVFVPRLIIDRWRHTISVLAVITWFIIFNRSITGWKHWTIVCRILCRLLKLFPTTSCGHMNWLPMLKMIGRFPMLFV